MSHAQYLYRVLCVAAMVLVAMGGMPGCTRLVKRTPDELQVGDMVPLNETVIIPGAPEKILKRVRVTHEIRYKSRATDYLSNAVLFGDDDTGTHVAMYDSVPLFLNGALWWQVIEVEIDGKVCRAARLWDSTRSTPHAWPRPGERSPYDYTGYISSTPGVDEVPSQQPEPPSP